MISSRLLRAQLQLQSHRLWLASFVARSRFVTPGPPAYAAGALDFHYGQKRAVQQKAAIRKTNEPSRHRFKKVKIKKDAAVVDQDQPTLEALRQAVQNGDISQVERLYNSIKDKSVIKPSYFRNIAQCLHQYLRVQQRSIDAQTRREAVEELGAFAEKLVSDVRGGRLSPHGLAHVHLLGFFKESGSLDAGVQFWQWLEQQDDLHVSPDVYGAAIELLAVNGAPLAEMERLYEQALERFPGNFSAYHLSPVAIVPNREQRTTLLGVPMALLQGILAARLLRGDTRNAYLALDTALRLYPDQLPHRFFQTFLEERPTLEAYTVFAIACRCGIVLPSNHFRQLLATLRTSSDLSSALRHALTVRAMLSATYMYMGAGGQITSNALNEIIITVTQFLRIKGVAGILPNQKQRLVIQVMGIIRSLLTILARCGVRPGLTAFNSIITNLGGFGHSKEITTIALADMQGLGLKPNEVTRRSILTAAGILSDAEYVVESWQGLVEGRIDTGQHPDATDFHVLIKNAALTGQIGFAASEFEKFRDVVPEKDHANIEAALEYSESARPPDKATECSEISSLSDEIVKVIDDIIIFDRKTQHSPKVQDFSNQPLPMTLLPDTGSTTLPEKDLRDLYDGLTAEPRAAQEDVAIDDDTTDLDPTFDIESSPPTESEEYDANIASTSEAAIDAQQLRAYSPTGIPFGELRYENWKSINYLLGLSKASDEAYLTAVDNAIAAGIVPPQRTLGLTLAKHTKLRSYGLSDTLRVAQEMRQKSAELNDAQIQERRDEILRLRGRL